MTSNVILDNQIIQNELPDYCAAPKDHAKKAAAELLKMLSGLTTSVVKKQAEETKEEAPSQAASAQQAQQAPAQPVSYRQALVNMIVGLLAMQTAVAKQQIWEQTSQAQMTSAGAQVQDQVCSDIITQINKQLYALDHQTVWQKVMDVLGPILMGLSVVVAFALSGPGAALVAGAMVGLSASGALSDIGNDIQSALIKAFPNNPELASVLSGICKIAVVVAISLIAGYGAGALDSLASSVAGAADNAAAGATTLRNAFVTWSTAGQAAMSVNPAYDFAMAIALKCTNDPDKQKEIAQIASIIINVIFMIASLVAGVKGGAGNSLESIMGNSYEKVAPLLNGIQRAGMIVSILGQMSYAGAQAMHGYYQVETGEALENQAPLQSANSLLTVYNQLGSMQIKQAAQALSGLMKNFSQENGVFETFTAGQQAEANALANSAA